VYGEQPGPRAVIITMGGVTWEDLQAADMPHLHDLAARAALGLMPVASPGEADPHRTWVSLGAGRAAAGGPLVGRLEDGIEGPLRLTIAPIVAANQRARTSARPGHLGEQLHRVGLTTALLAAPGAASYPALAVIADAHGDVDGGCLDVPLVTGTPRGPVAAPGALRALRQALARWDVVMLDLTGVPLAAADEFVAAAVDAVRDQHALIAVLSPVAPQRPGRRSRSLAPVLLWTSAEEHAAGLLGSRSTRWPGIIVPADFAPTLLEWWGVEQPSLAMGGRPLGVIPAADAVARVSELSAGTARAHHMLITAAVCYLVFGFAVVAAAVAVGLWRTPALRRFGAAALGLTTGAIGLAVAPALGITSTAGHLGAGAAVGAGLAFAAARLRRPGHALALAMLLGVGLLAVDAVSGSWLMRRSALGLGVISGSRFYGIGNEAVGFLVGMAAVGLGALLDAFPRRGELAALIGVGVVLIVGAPFWGANWGGAVATAAGLVTLYLLYKQKVGWEDAVGAAVLLAASALAPALLDLLGPAEARSHIGAAAAALLAGEGRPLGDAVARKLYLNARILTGSPAAIPLVLAAAAAFAFTLRPAAPARRLLSQHRGLRAGVAGALAGGLAASVTNDSGLGAGLGAFAVAISALLFLSARGQEAAP